MFQYLFLAASHQWKWDTFTPVRLYFVKIRMWFLYARLAKLKYLTNDRNSTKQWNKVQHVSGSARQPVQRNGGIGRNVLRASQVCTVRSQKTSFQLHNYHFHLNGHPGHCSVLLSDLLCPTCIGTICWQCGHRVVCNISPFHSGSLHNKISHPFAEASLPVR